MNAQNDPAVRVWGSQEKEGRRRAAPIVAKAFARSVSMAASTVTSCVLSAAILSLVFGIEQVAPILPLLLPGCYVLNVAVLWIVCRCVPGGEGGQWWIIEDARGRAAVLTKPTSGHTTAYNLAANPKRRGLAGDLMPYVAAHVAPPLCATAYPSVARIYTQSGMATDRGPARWPMRGIEFTTDRDTKHL